MKTIKGKTFGPFGLVYDRDVKVLAIVVNCQNPKDVFLNVAAALIFFILWPLYYLGHPMIGLIFLGIIAFFCALVWLCVRLQWMPNPFQDSSASTREASGR